MDVSQTHIFPYTIKNRAIGKCKHNVINTVLKFSRELKMILNLKKISPGMNKFKASLNQKLVRDSIKVKSSCKVIQNNKRKGSFKVNIPLRADRVSEKQESKLPISGVKGINLFSVESVMDLGQISNQLYHQIDSARTDLDMMAAAQAQLQLTQSMAT